MSYTVQLIRNEPIIVVAFGEDFNLSNEISALNKEVFALLDAAIEKTSLIVDVSRVVLSLADIMEGASAAARGERPPLRHPQVKQNIVITQDAVTRLAAQGMRTATFGNVNVAVADSMDEALAMARGA